VREPSRPAARVLIVDDHPVVRHGLSALLRSGGLEVVGEAASGDDAIDAARSLAPDVVVMDLSLPGTSGIEATRRLRDARPGCAVVVLTAFADRDRVLAAVDAGASGYLLKDDDPSELVAGIRAAGRGGSPFSPQVAGALVGARAVHRERADLTPREREALGLVADGLSNKQIARRLGIAEGTVKAHLGRAFRRIGVRHRTQAALWVERQRQR
jgi:DNA-binding NarL/FixJ family response regulator